MTTYEIEYRVRCSGRGLPFHGDHEHVELVDSLPAAASLVDTWERMSDSGTPLDDECLPACIEMRDVARWSAIVGPVPVDPTELPKPAGE